MKLIIILFYIIFSYSFELKYNSFEAEFNQSVESDNKTIHYYGKVAVNSNLIFWHYLKPIEKKIWVTTDKIYIYEPDLEQVTIHSISKKDNFFKLLKESRKIDNNLYSKKIENKTIFFKVDKKMIKKIYYKDKVDNLVTLNFFNIKKREFQKKRFIPNYPEYVDKIYMK